MISAIGERVHPLAVTNCFATGVLVLSSVCFAVIPGMEYRWDLSTLQWIILLLIGITGSLMVGAPESTLYHTNNFLGVLSYSRTDLRTGWYCGIHDIIASGFSTDSRCVYLGHQPRCFITDWICTGAVCRCGD